MKIFAIFILFLSFQTKADAISSAAIRYGQKALFSYPLTNKFKKDTEKYLFSFLPIQKERIAIIGGIGLVLYSGSFSTRNFNNLTIGVLGWNVAPELSLNTKNGQAFALISINKQF